MKLSGILVLAIAGLIATFTPLTAQNRFAPVVQIGEELITRFQVAERARFLSLLNAPGDTRNLAREQLINEAVQRRAAEAAGIELSEEELRSGMAEFAGRANLDVEQFLSILQQNGVGPETFRDFIGAGVVWRNLVRSRFQESARDLSPTQIERSLASSGTEGGLRVLVSEILLPAASPETERASRERAATLRNIASEAEFAIAARQYSVAASRAAGGALNWTPLEGLPAEIQSVISRLTPGQISPAVELENAIGLFYLREIERVAAGTPDSLSVDYALFVTGGGPDEALAVQRKIDVCDDLYGVAQGLPEDRLVREILPVASLPADIRSEVARLDVNEVSTRLTRGGSSTVLMLCARKPELESSVDFDIVTNRLVNSRLAVLAADYLADLRAASDIIEFDN